MKMESAALLFLLAENPGIFDPKYIPLRREILNAISPEDRKAAKMIAMAMQKIIRDETMPKSLKRVAKPARQFLEYAGITVEARLRHHLPIRGKKRFNRFLFLNKKPA